jgi:hypothetical protein
LNRGIPIDFRSKEDKSKAYVFLKQYNELAKIENTKKKKPVFEIPEEAERSLERSLRIQNNVRKKQERVDNPFVVKERPAPRQSSINPPHMIQDKSKKRLPKLYDVFEDNEIETTYIYDKTLQYIDFS